MSEGERAVPQPPHSGERDDAGRRALASRETLGAEADQRERYGPLELERTLKDDGRVLIYYSAGEPSS